MIGRSYGVDPELIQQAIQRARRERSEAFWALLKRAFGRRATSASEREPMGARQTPAALC